MATIATSSRVSTLRLASSLGNLRQSQRSQAGSRLANSGGMRTRDRSSASGFSLLETLVATSLLITVMAGLADLLARSVQRTRDTGRQSAALDAAQAKLEWLRAREWQVNADGVSVSDPSLAPSSPDALDHTTAGYSDWLDEAGQAVDGGGVVLRRWSITPIDVGPPDTIAIEVCVFRSQAKDEPATAADICLATVRVRQP